MKIRNMVLVIALVLGIALLFVAPVLAQGTEPPPVTTAQTTEADIIKLIAFTVLITGFFKQQFGLQGRMILLAGFIIIVILGFLPDIQALFPTGAYLIDKFVLILKVFLSSAGLFDTAVNVGAKIATATVTKSGTLSTSKTQ
jgi:hypothetical protein